MPCYIQKVQPPTQAEYKLWQGMGYLGTFEQYAQMKERSEGQHLFITGELGDHCADCMAVGDYLCDFPVGEGKTCDRPMCDAHSKEIGPELHYCLAHQQMWERFKASGGVSESLRNVVAFKAEK